jgi:HPt (histidine-containing phosphotransfer) domain-containing protein
VINSSRPLPAPADQLTSVLSTIAAQARRTNLVRAAEIRAALEHAGTAGLSGDGWGAAQRSAHQLAGSAGTFGYGRASELARSLEQQLAQLGHRGDAPLETRLLTESVSLLDQLTEELAGDPDLA